MNFNLAERAAALNDRVRYGLIILIALAGFDLLTRLESAALSSVASREIAQRQFARVGGDLDLDEWRARAAEANVALDRWRAQVWRGPTPGVIAADIQSRLRSRSLEHGVGVRRVEVDPVPLALAQGEGLRVQFEASMRSASQFAQFFGELEQSVPVLFIDELSLTIGQNDQAYFSFSGVAPIAVETPVSAGGDAGSGADE